MEDFESIQPPGPVVSFVRAGISPAANAGVVGSRLPQGNDSNEVEISTEQTKEGHFILGSSGISSNSEVLV